MGLTTEGILFLAIAWSIIITLVTYCFIKVFKSERKKT
jgi:hypothetical protein